MNVQPQDKILLVCEDPKYGWYDHLAGPMLTDAIHAMGAIATTIPVGSPDDPLPENYNAQIDAHDAVIYLARIGDQDRFTNNLPGKNVAMLYSRDAATLSSPYGATSHHAMKDLKTAIDQVTFSSDLITITCPRGTSLKCRVESESLGPEGEVTINRFPLCVPQPVLAQELSGRIALSKWLTPTGSRSYSPASCRFNSTVFAIVEQGKILRFEGEADCVKAINSHYDFVSDKFGIERDVIHSWHAGIHPACSYPHKIEDDPDRWSNNVFGSPRFLHFHTCGNYPPGEICLMVLDPTIAMDGVPMWKDGRLKLDNFKDTAAVTSSWPELKPLVDGPDQPVGSDIWV